MISNSYQQRTIITQVTLLKTAAQKDYDLYNGGWGPDYLDPSTYLDIFSVKNGGVLQNLGLEPGEANDKAKAVGLDTYTQMLEEANKSKTQPNVMRNMLIFKHG